MSLFATLPAKERELFYLQHQQGRGIGPVIAEKTLGLLAVGPHLLAAPARERLRVQRWRVALEGVRCDRALLRTSIW